MVRGNKSYHEVYLPSTDTLARRTRSGQQFVSKLIAKWTFQFPTICERDLIARRTGLSPLLAPLLRARSTCVWIQKCDKGLCESIIMGIT